MKYFSLLFLLAWLGTTSLVQSQSTSTALFCTDSLSKVINRALHSTSPGLPVHELLHVSSRSQPWREVRARRSIAPQQQQWWIRNEFDRNNNGQLDSLDAFDHNQDGDLDDPKEFFIRRGRYWLSPSSDSLVWNCSDLNDSLWVQLEAIDSSGQLHTCEQVIFLEDLIATQPISKLTDTIKIQRLEGDFYGKGIVKAEDLLLVPVCDCNGQGDEKDHWGRSKIEHYSINEQGKEVDSAQTQLTYTCCDMLKYPVLQIHAWDKLGHFSTRLVRINFFNSRDTCLELWSTDACAPPLQASLSVKILTEDVREIPGVKIKLAYSTLVKNQFSNTSGETFFTNLPLGENCQVEFDLDTLPLNGVSTFDIVLLQKHILGVQPFKSPYQYIAADVNRSGSISTLDAIHMRRLILGQIDRFPNNQSWRFIDGYYLFEKPLDPLGEVVKETFYLDLLYAQNNLNIVGIKIGDLNYSVTLK